MKTKPLFLLFALLAFAASLPAAGQVSRLDKRFGVNKRPASHPAAKPTPKAPPKPAASAAAHTPEYSQETDFSDKEKIIKYLSQKKPEVLKKLMIEVSDEGVITLKRRDGYIPTLIEALADVAEIGYEYEGKYGDELLKYVVPCCRENLSEKMGYRYRLTDEPGNTRLLVACDDLLITKRNLPTLKDKGIQGISDAFEINKWNPATYELESSYLLVSSEGFGYDWFLSKEECATVDQNSLGERTFDEYSPSSPIYISQSERLNRIPLLHGIQYDFNRYYTTDVLKIDYSHLSGKAVGESEKGGTKLDISKVPGLPDRSDWRSVHIPHSSFYLIFPEKQGDPWHAQWWTEEYNLQNVYLYNSVLNQSFPANGVLGLMCLYGVDGLTTKATAPFVWSTECGKLVANVYVHGWRANWWSSALVVNSPDGRIGSLFDETIKGVGVDTEHLQELSRLYSIEKEPLDKKSSLGSIRSSLGSALCVWNPIPGQEGKTYLLTAGDGHCDLYLMDDRAKTGKLMQRWWGGWYPYVGGRGSEDSLDDGGMMKGDLPAWLPERKWLFLPVMPHCWDVYELDEQTVQAARKFQLFTGNDGSYALVLPDGRYAGTPGCEKMLVRYENKEKRSMEPLAPWLNRPGEVLEAIGGDPDDVAALKATTRRWLQKRGYDPDAMPPLPQVRELPHVELDTGHVRYETAWGSRVAKLPLRVMAAGRPVEQLDVRVNGAPLPSRQMKLSPKGEDRVELSVPLTDGHCRIEVVAVDQEGYRSETAAMVVPAAASPWPVTYLVAIGVSDYEDESLHLKYAAKDAKDIAAAFQQYGAGKTETLVLTDGEARDASALEKVREFLGQAWPEDRVILYVAGHGILDEKLDYYYAPAGFDREDPAGSGISLDSLKDCLKGTRALNRLLLLDTCHSGFLGEAGEEKLAASGVQLPQGVRAIQQRGMQVKQVPAAAMNTARKTRYVEELFAMDSAEDGINVIAASAGAEYALESDEWANGVLTASIMEALSGRVTTEANADGWMSLEELQARVVRSVSERTGGLQRPSVVLTEGAGQIRLAPTLDSYIRKEEWDKVRELLDKGMKIEEARYFTSYSLVTEALYHNAPVGIIAGLLKAGATASPMGATEAEERLLADFFVYGEQLYPSYYGFAKNSRLPHPYSRKDALQIVELLLQHGANPTALKQDFDRQEMGRKIDRDKILYLKQPYAGVKYSPLTALSQYDFYVPEYRKLLLKYGGYHVDRTSEDEYDPSKEKGNNTGLTVEKSESSPTVPSPTASETTPANAAQAQALYQKGLDYALGRGVPQSDTETVRYYQQAAELGLPEAQHNLAVRYMLGKGTAKDPVKAAEWYATAAYRGYAPSQLSYGMCLMNGNGVAKDPAAALRFYAMAAAQGNADAQYFLGCAYLNGTGITANKSQGISYLQQAARQGNEPARKKLKSLKQSW